MDKGLGIKQDIGHACLAKKSLKFWVEDYYNKKYSILDLTMQEHAAAKNGTTGMEPAALRFRCSALTN